MNNLVNLEETPRCISPSLATGHPKPWDVPGGYDALMQPESQQEVSEQSAVGLGYVSLKQLQDFAVEVEASDTEVSSRMLATNAFRRPLREALFAESNLGESNTEKATLEDPERGQLLSLDFLKASVEAGRLTEKRPPSFPWPGIKDRPPVLGPKTVKLLQDYIDHTEATSR